MRVDPNGHDWWHWLIGAVIVVALVALTIVSAGGFAAGMLAIGGALNGIAVGSALTTVLAFSAVGAGVVLAASAVYSGVNGVDVWARTGDFSAGISTIMSYGETALWSTVTAGVISGVIGYGAYLEQKTFSGTKTPGRSTPYSTYRNTKGQTITHYDENGNMWWSKHLTDHGNSTIHPVVPHWHWENPHNTNYLNRWQFIIEYLNKLFGR